MPSPGLPSPSCCSSRSSSRFGSVLFPLLPLLLLVLLLAGCAAKRPTQLQTLHSGDALTLGLGANRSVLINGLEYNLVLVRSEAGSATIRVNAQDFALRQGEEFSFGDFVIRLERSESEGATFRFATGSPNS